MHCVTAPGKTGPGAGSSEDTFCSGYYTKGVEKNEPSSQTKYIDVVMAAGPGKDMISSGSRGNKQGAVLSEVHYKNMMRCGGDDRPVAIWTLMTGLEPVA